MAQIQVIIQDHTGAKKTPVELPDDVPMKRLLHPLLIKMGLPTSHTDYFWEFRRDSPGEPIVYVVDNSRTGRQLSEAESLANGGVRNGDTLRLYPEVATDWSLVENAMMFPNGKKFSEVGVVMALQLNDLFTAFIVPKSMPVRILREFIAWQSLGRDRSLTQKQLDRLWKGILRNKTSGEMIDDQTEFTVSGVIRSGDLICAEVGGTTLK